jgi:fused signal recognition particle receptor
MTYTIIAIVVLVVVVLFVLISRRSAGGAEPTADKPTSLPKPQAKPARAAGPTAPGAEAKKAAEAPKETAPTPPVALPSGSTQLKPGDLQPTPEPPAAPRDLSVLRKGLAKARGDGGFLGRLANLFAGKKELDPAIADQVEEILLTSDVGVATTQAILGRLRDGLDKNELQSSQAVWDALRTDAKRILAIGGGKLAASHKPEVIFMVGVNGVGKTTTIGKLASKFKSEGRSVLLAAGDTFRAAAVQQLEVWGKRIGCEVVQGKEGADPGAVIFDAIQKARQSAIDVVLADTAGRLQTKTPLMDELKKITRTMQKAMEGAPHETLLVLDATNGQNAVSQAKMFQEAIPLTGIVLTKLDGTAKGGVILGISDELKIPVRYVGLGERADDLREFNADEFVEALFGSSAEETAAA